jgi:hypothetical protein
MTTGAAFAQAFYDARKRDSSTLPCYSAFGTAQMLRQIVHRAALADGDLEAIRAACMMLERAAKEGVL